jgi:hypothetical protein
MSPRTMANTNPSSSPIVATTKTALAIPDLGIPSSRVSSPIVCVLEVATPRDVSRRFLRVRGWLAELCT